MAFPWAIGPFHPLGRLGLRLEVEAEGSSSQESDSTELESSLFLQSSLSSVSLSSVNIFFSNIMVGKKSE